MKDFRELGKVTPIFSELDDILDVTTDNQRLKLHKMLRKYKLVLACGVLGTDKAGVLESYNNYNKNLTLWSRKPIMDMVCQGRSYEPKYNRYIENLENEMLPKVLEGWHNQLVVHGLYRMRSARRRVLGYLRGSDEPSCLLVFDAPAHMIVDRMINRGHRMGYLDDELLMEVKKQQDTFDWPRFSEGFDRIYYINTFGEAGIEYQLQRPYIGR